MGERRYPSKPLEYEKPDLSIGPFDGHLETLLQRPPGLLSDWPPVQISYLNSYLQKLGCKTVLLETQYVDRDYIDDHALFYSRSLRNYPNHCARIHFFSDSFSEETWGKMLVETSNGHSEESEKFLNDRYLGYCIVRPLPGYPVGRTVLKTFAPAGEGFKREFGCIRPYDVNLCGLELQVRGLAFQQQDQGVSACATTAVWSAVNSVAWAEGQRVATPAEITQAASRYLLLGGRSLPSEGLGIHQICEAIRGVGLAPILIQSISPQEDRPQLQTYIQSGFAPVLAIKMLSGIGGHAVCAVGYKKGAVKPQTNPALHFSEVASSLDGLYLHDDRIGPYAVADIYPFTTDQAVIKTAIRIRWPGESTEFDHAVLQAIIVPVPVKLRLSATRLREVGLAVAEYAGLAFAPIGPTTFNCRYTKAVAYKKAAYRFSLSHAGLRTIVEQTPMSRYLGVVEVFADGEPFFDVLVDTTETHANPSVLAGVLRRPSAAAVREELAELFSKLAAVLIV